MKVEVKEIIYKEDLLKLLKSYEVANEDAIESMKKFNEFGTKEKYFFKGAEFIINLLKKDI